MQRTDEVYFMEQKKILWIVAAVSVFVLVIFGFALVIYSPPRTAETGRQTASAVIPGQAAEIARRNVADSNSAVAVDPDSWVMNPEITPGLDTEIVPAPEAESLTSINSAYVANGSAIAETINVRDLASRGQTALPETQGGDTAIRQSAITAPAAVAAAPVQNEQPAESAQATASRANETPAQAEPRQTAVVQNKPASSEPAKQTVVEYWIQTGSFSSKLNAESARKMLTERYLNAEIFTKEINGTQTYRVRVGPYADKEEADYWLGTIAETPEFSGSYVSRVTAQR